MADKKVKYVKHPITLKEKIKLRKAGYTIVDARFDPNPKAEAAKAATPEPVVEEEASKSGFF